jgi:hypothetical protein
VKKSPCINVLYPTLPGFPHKRVLDTPTINTTTDSTVHHQHHTHDRAAPIRFFFPFPPSLLLLLKSSRITESCAQRKSCTKGLLSVLHTHSSARLHWFFRAAPPPQTNSTPKGTTASAVQSTTGASQQSGQHSTYSSPGRTALLASTDSTNTHTHTHKVLLWLLETRQGSSQCSLPATVKPYTLHYLNFEAHPPPQASTSLPPGKQNQSKSTASHQSPPSRESNRLW